MINWNDFSIGETGKVLINNANGATLNRVLGGQISRINGLLSATGSVYLMNPNGVIVGAGGRVISGGNFVASTREMNIDAFMAGGPLIVKGESGGVIVNAGEIVSRQGGVVMIARSVTNSGTITANGQVTLAAADDVLLGAAGAGRRGCSSRCGPAAATSPRPGRIQAAAVALKAAEGNVFALAGNRDGLIQATGSQTIDGQLWLTAPKGAVEVSGVLTAGNLSGAGGKVVVNGKDVVLASTAVVSAPSRGGEVLVGTSGYRTGADLAERNDGGERRQHPGGRAVGRRPHRDVGPVPVAGRRRGSTPAGAATGWIDPDDLTIDAAAASTITGTLNGGTNVTQQTTASAARAAWATSPWPRRWSGRDRAT